MVRTKHKAVPRVIRPPIAFRTEVCRIEHIGDSDGADGALRTVVLHDLQLEALLVRPGLGRALSPRFIRSK